MKQRKSMIALFCLMAALVLGACSQTGTETSGTTAEQIKETETTAAQTAVQETEAVTESQQAEAGTEETAGMMERVIQEIAENKLTYAPKVTTLESGVQVQRTPQDNGIYNVYFLHADNRGCYTCHTDLNENLKALPVSEWNWGLTGSHHFIDYDGDVKMSVMNCFGCHTKVEMQTYMHNMHDSSNTAFEAMGGDCMSCHFVTEEGEMALWDEVKYDVLRGINDADASLGSFSYDCTTVSKDDKLFNMNWMSIAWFIDEMSFVRYQDDVEGVEATDEEFDEWTITINGEVAEEKTYTLPELIDMGISKTTQMAYMCIENEGNGALIRQVEVTGISVKALLEKVGLTDKANYVETHDRGSMYRYPCPMELSWMDDHEALLVYEINGRRLDVREGFPVSIWVEGYDAGYFVKHVDTLTVLEEYTGDIRINSLRDGYEPRQSIFYTQEGQIIEAYEPYTFEGYAYGVDQPIDYIEISMDRGATWVKYETPDSEVGRWTYWRYTFIPDTPGAYVIYVRATANGVTSTEPAKILVNAQ